VEERTVVRENKHFGIRSEGRYRQQTWPNGKPYWVLTHWRVAVNGQFGDWHKVHGRQRRPCAGFALLLDE
jgi:hypothetical protein